MRRNRRPRARRGTLGAERISLRIFGVSAIERKPISHDLAGAGIVVTRPAGTGASLARSISARGGWPVRLPGLALRKIDDAATRSALARHGKRHLAIFTSPAAVRFAFALRPSLRLAKDTVFAIGAGTARALARRGVTAAYPLDRSDSEGLLALPALAKPRGRRVAIVGAPGGRDLIAPTLRRRGAKVEPIAVYRREPPRLTARHLAALAAAPDPLLTLVSSGEALANLVARLPDRELARMRRQTVVVSSARLAALARKHGFRTLVEARSAAPRDLLDAAATALSRRRR